MSTPADKCPERGAQDGDKAIRQPPRDTHRHLELDIGEERIRYRVKWYQLWRPANPPPPAPTSLEDSTEIPLASANFFSVLTYHWLSPIMTLGYQRALQAPDLWKMDSTRECGVLSRNFDDAWARHCKVAEEWNARLEKGDVNPSMMTRGRWLFTSLHGGPGIEESERRWRVKDGRKEPSMARALHDVFGWTFWSGGLFKVVGDISQLMTPLLIRALIQFAQERGAAVAAGSKPPAFGRPIGMAIGMFLLTVFTSLCQHQFFWRSMATGVLARAALIGSLYKRGLAMTPKERNLHPGAALVNHMSTDISRIDYAAQWFHAAWTAPIQVTACLILLLVQLGPSALAGFALFLLIIPIQERAMTLQFQVRKASMKWTDNRAKLLQELLASMRIIKYFCYEIPYLGRIFSVRSNELKGVRKILMIRAANLAVAFSVPALAAILAILTYNLSGRGLDPAVVFPALSLFNLLRQPLIFLPRALSATADAKNALQRLRDVFKAELLTDDGIATDRSLPVAIRVQHATFQWEEVNAHANDLWGKGRKQVKKAGKEERARNQDDTLDAKPAAPAGTKDEQPFSLKDVNLEVPRGRLCAIVGPVGSGKSSLLSGLLGEMKQLAGTVVFGGSVAYCSQIAWIQNASVRDNVLFGRPFDEERYWQACRDASLITDLELFPDGDLTEIGEKGINLSGGQKQRVNIARALYSDADVVIMDDPLSAVDAHVGKALFENAIIGSLKDKGKTILLVTHALHLVSRVDYIYTISNGQIAEQGTHLDLMSKDGPFARLMKEFGGEQDAKEDGIIGEDIQDADAKAQAKRDEAAESDGRKGRFFASKAIGKAAGTGKIEGRLIRSEKRTVGSLSKNVYFNYMKASKGWITIPVILLNAALMQACQTLNNYTLVWWQSNTFNWPNGFYMLLYAMLGIGNSVFTFGLGAAMGWESYLASRSLHHDALFKVFHAPMAFFDTTPLGRILGVFGKDIDTLDNQLSDALRMFMLAVSNIAGAVILITVLLHYFIVAVVVLSLGYSYFAAYYGESARELKRLDSALRSLLYSHFSESLSGLVTIRAYGETKRFIADDEYFVDLEDRALLLMCANQRWLSIRLDFMGGLMVFTIGVLCAVGVNGISPAQIGLALSYSTYLTQTFGMLTRQSAEVENYMNAVERITQYSHGNTIEQEASHEPTDYPLPKAWPTKGTLELHDVVMSYRNDLPPVLKGISMSIRDGEKIGVVGRTGAGKTSLITALYRLQELSSGTISIDGVDVSKIGLRDLRSKVAIIPQEPVLFQGTIRSNLDPFSEHDDIDLNDALRRAHLIGVNDKKPSLGEDGEGARTPPGTRFTLDTPVDAEGSNFSVGERSLLSLARALVKDSKIICLDEATASVDLETDSKIQFTIQREFRDRTMICIAHRLRTILSYDRICVMDQGNVVELDAPEDLFANTSSIFRSMCDRSSITSEDIRVAVQTRQLTV